jgi:hypothetical protein
MPTGAAFPSSFPDPTPRDIERYLKVKRVADPSSNAAPNEMAAARKEMDKLEAEFPRIKILAVLSEQGVDLSAPVSSGHRASGYASPANPFDPYAFVSNVFDTFAQGARAYQSMQLPHVLATQVEITRRTLIEGRVRVNTTLDATTLDTIAQMDAMQRERFARAVAERVAAEVLAAVDSSE